MDFHFTNFKIPSQTSNPEDNRNSIQVNFTVQEVTNVQFPDNTINYNNSWENFLGDEPVGGTASEPILFDPPNIWVGEPAHLEGSDLRSEIHARSETTHDFPRLQKATFTRTKKIQIIAPVQPLVMPKRKKFTLKEDLLLAKLFNQVGTSWAKMVPDFNGRTPVMLKNRFYAYLNKGTKLIEVTKLLNEVERSGKLEDFHEGSLEHLRARITEKGTPQYSSGPMDEKAVQSGTEGLSLLRNEDLNRQKPQQLQEAILTLEQQLAAAAAEIKKLKDSIRNENQQKTSTSQ